MSITVERRYRVTTPNGTESDMSEEEARALALGLLAALGLAPAAMADAEPVPAMVAPPAQLPSGSVGAFPARARIPRSRQTPQAYEVRMRALIADGLTAAEVGAAMGVPRGTVQSRAHRLGLRFGGRRAAPLVTHAAKEAAASVRLDGETRTVADIPVPSVSATEAAAVHGAVGWAPDGGWTREQTTALIRAMAPGHGGIREASEATGHSMGGCGLRWKHLKSAGIMTVEKYQSGPEAVPA